LIAAGSLRSPAALLWCAAGNSNRVGHTHLREIMTPHRLERSDDRIVAGVCAGIAAFLGWRPISIRALFSVLALLSFGGLAIVYLVLWWMMPPRAKEGSFRLDDFRAQ
jgi:phage shock protein C